MPTPFSHLLIAESLLEDPLIPLKIREVLGEYRPEFHLGNIAADAKETPDTPRDTAHFYPYDVKPPIVPWQEMLQLHPSLRHPTATNHKVFIAGYVAHLAIDIYWSLNMVRPHFVVSNWGDSRRFKFLVLHLLLIYMDERDYDLLDEQYVDVLLQAQPQDWLPFMSDETLLDWKHFVANQLPPNGISETLSVFGERVGKSSSELRTILDDPTKMQAWVWDNIPSTTLAEIEVAMVDHAREQLLLYWNLP